MVFFLSILIRVHRASCFCKSVFFIKFVKDSDIISEGFFCFILILFRIIITHGPSGVLDYLILSHIPEVLLSFFNLCSLCSSVWIITVH